MDKWVGGWMEGRTVGKKEKWKEGKMTNILYTFNLVYEEALSVKKVRLYKHTRQTTDTPGFKSFANNKNVFIHVERMFDRNQTFSNKIQYRSTASSSRSMN